MRVAGIVAMSGDGVIGNKQGLPWRLPKDLKRFRELTWGKPVVLGRKTWESIGRPLPGRHIIVVTRNPRYVAEGCQVAASLLEALDRSGDWLDPEHQEVMIAGGAEVFREAMPLWDRIYLTVVAGRFAGDVYFPEEALRLSAWQVVQEEAHPADEKNPHPHRFYILDRDRAAPPGSPKILAELLAGTSLP